MRLLLLKAVHTGVISFNDGADIVVLELISVELRDHEVRIDSNKCILHIGINLAIQKPAR